MDEDGFIYEGEFIYIVDREKEMIIRGGDNVYPPEIEEAPYTHPGLVGAAGGSNSF